MTASRPQEPELTAFEQALAELGEGDCRGYTPGGSVPEPTRGPSDPAGISAPRPHTDPAAGEPEPRTASRATGPGATGQPGRRTG